MMTSRERVNKAVNFQIPDRVPIDLGGLKASGIALEACARVREKLGLSGVCRAADVRFMIAEIDDALRRRFRVDVLPLDISMVAQQADDGQWLPWRLRSGRQALLPPGTNIRRNADGSCTLLNSDGSDSDFRMPAGGFYFDDMAFDRPGGAIRPAEFRPVDNIDDRTLKLMADRARMLQDQSDCALLGWGGGVCFLGMSLITDWRSNVAQRRPSDWMMMLMTEKETCHEMMGRAVDASIRCLSQLHDAVGDRCFAWGIAADDSGTQRGEFIRPDLWAEMIKPHYARLCKWIHQHTNWKTFFHCCGSIYNLIPHFIDAGMDILNPIQTSAANMDPARLKREFGGRIVFWGGGCDTQSVLKNATPQQIREHVRERMSIFKPGGGYVFNQIHNIQADVPPENIIAMFDAAYEFGGY